MGTQLSLVDFGDWHDPFTASPTDRRLTPTWVTEAVREMAGGRIALDPCTEPHNPTGAVRYLTEAGEKADWRELLALDEAPKYAEPWLPLVWVNPPFSQMWLWVEKVMAEAGCTRLLFTAVDYTPGWWQQLDDGAAMARCELRKRPKCYDPETGKTMDVARSATVWLLGDSLRALLRFEAAFRPLGRVVRLF